MKIPYKRDETGESEAFPKEKYIYRPKISVVIEYRNKLVGDLALIDSGADHCVFSYRSIGDYLGINLKKGKKLKAFGISNKAINIYFHNITLYIKNHKFKIYAGFCYELEHSLLGRSGFFDKFKIMFDDQNKIVTLEPYK